MVPTVNTLILIVIVQSVNYKLHGRYLRVHFKTPEMHITEYVNKIIGNSIQTNNGNKTSTPLTPVLTNLFFNFSVFTRLTFRTQVYWYVHDPRDLVWECDNNGEFLFYDHSSDSWHTSIDIKSHSSQHKDGCRSGVKEFKRWVLNRQTTGVWVKLRSTHGLSLWERRNTNLGRRGGGTTHRTRRCDPSMTEMGSVTQMNLFNSLTQYLIWEPFF